MDHIQAVTKQHFFNHIDDFMDYRKTIYETSDQTIKSNSIDIRLFKDFVEMNQYQYIDGKAVMNFQYYLKQQRLNSGASMNRKLFTLIPQNGTNTLNWNRYLMSIRCRSMMC